MGQAGSVQTASLGTQLVRLLTTMGFWGRGTETLLVAPEGNVKIDPADDWSAFEHNPDLAQVPGFFD